MKMLSTLLAVSLSLYGTAIPSDNALTLDEAIEILKQDNLEIKAAQLEYQSTQAKTNQVSAMNWGTLDLELNAANSDDAGNVFGFKLTSRQATFGDLGLADFVPQPGIFEVKPSALNNPDSTNFFQTKLEYTLPIYVGGKISGYTDISRSMEKMQQLETDKTVNTKIYETRKAFYDMALLETGRVEILDNKVIAVFHGLINGNAIIHVINDFPTKLLAYFQFRCSFCQHHLQPAIEEKEHDRESSE